MDYKVKSLFNKIYVDFIKGKYGKPKIPTKSEVIFKMEEITSLDYTPITKYEIMKDIDINYIRTEFSNIIDDVDILFDSIEAESKDILDQLTYSLKEHNGVKRELRHLSSRCSDISAGVIGEEYLNYNVTETFDTLDNINVLRSDPVNLEAGNFTIRKDYENILTLDHYVGTKLEFNVIENYSNIITQEYIGSTDAAIMLDQQDPRQLVYKIVTNRPTRLRTAIALQLTRDSREIEINSVTLDIDSDIAKGFIRLYYKSSYKWNDIDNSSIQEVKGNKVVFNFYPIKCSHIKIEFIKDSPDVFDTNSYYYIINNIAISKNSTKKESVLYSNPIILDSYSKEFPIITSLAVSGEFEIPKETEIKLYVAQDILISGAFLNSNGSEVDAKSPEAYTFDQSYSGTVFLSDLWNAKDTLTGVFPYKGIDYNWKQLKLYNSNKETINEIVEFENTKTHNKLDNSIFTITSGYLFGDITYTGIYTVSGWVNTDNPYWNILEPYVNSGVYVSGVDVADLEGITWNEIEPSGILNSAILSNPLYSGQWIGYSSGIGYPFNNSDVDTGIIYTFGYYLDSINGWWRPLTMAVTPTGIEQGYADGEHLSGIYENTSPDFYFNNIPFYKIYKFGYNSTVIDPTIKLYTFQERPINNTYDYYPSNFIWKYNNKWIDRIGTTVNVTDDRMIGDNPLTSWEDYIITIPSTNLRLNEEYIVDSISEVRVHGTNIVLEPNEYFVKSNYGYDNAITSINLSPLNTGNRTIKPEEVSFDYKYKYRVKNEYLSTWNAYIILYPSENSYIEITNIFVENNENLKVIKNISIEDLDTGIKTIYEDDNGKFTINFPSTKNLQNNKHYKITIFCASDSSTGHCSNGWVPYENSYKKNSTITVSPLIKIVQKLNSLKIVDLSDLIYDTPMNNDNRVAIIEMDNNEKYLITKIPSKDTFPGYYFNSLRKQYYSNSENMIENNGHWIRQGVMFSGYNYSDIFTYTTGSSGAYIYEKDRSTIDLAWNNGSTFLNYPNTRSEFFNHHSTIGYPINIDLSGYFSYFLREDMYDPRTPYQSGLVGSDDWKTWLVANISDGETDLNYYLENQILEVSDINRGFLFYPTAENLPTYYSISYKTVSGTDDTNSRFLYKLILTSNDEGSLVPKVKSLKFKINEKV